jgi:hypothetical protein
VDLFTRQESVRIPSLPWYRPQEMQAAIRKKRGTASQAGSRADSAETCSRSSQGCRLAVPKRSDSQTGSRMDSVEGYSRGSQGRGTVWQAGSKAGSMGGHSGAGAVLWGCECGACGTCYDLLPLLRPDGNGLGTIEPLLCLGTA